MLFEIILKLLFAYGGFLAIKGELNIGALGQYVAGRFTYAVLIWSVIVVDTYHNYIEGKYF